MTATLSHNLLKDALLDAPKSRKDAILSRAFSHWFSGMVYNQIWEDPEVDAAALKMGPASKMFTIASGGCNILNYLSYDPERVTAVDLNSHHLALTRLKLAALKGLERYEDFHSMFACADNSGNLAIFKNQIRPLLGQEEIDYWEKPVALKTPKIRKRIDYFANNLYNYSRSGYFLRFLHAICWLAGCSPEKMLQARSLEEQREFYEKYMAKAFRHPIVRILGRLPLSVFSLGIPPHQFRSLAESSSEGIIGVFKQRVERLCCDFPIQTNYFAWQSLARRYNSSEQTALPRYLQREHFQAIRSRVSRVDTTHTSLTERLRSLADKSYNCFSFLDAQDWMSKEQLTELWTEVARVCEDGGRVVFRTAGTESPLEANLPPELMARFRFFEEESLELHKQDRSGIYGGFFIYEKL